MSAAADLVDAMGGELSIVSELGKGSTFTVTLRDVEVSRIVPEEETAAAKADISRPELAGKLPVIYLG